MPEFYGVLHVKNLFSCSLQEAVFIEMNNSKAKLFFVYYKIKIQLLLWEPDRWDRVYKTHVEHSPERNLLQNNMIL